MPVAVRAAHLPTELRIRLSACRSVSEFLDRHASDVSRGGIFVRNTQVLAVGCVVRLNLQLADGSTLLAGEGTVFWTREADPTRAESEPGMGIRFTRLTVESQRMLTHLLAEKTERERRDDRGDFDEDERTVVATQEEMEAAATSGDEAVPAAYAALASVPLAIPPPGPAALPTRRSAPSLSVPVVAALPAPGPRAPSPVLSALPAIDRVAPPAPASLAHTHASALPPPAPRLVEVAAPRAPSVSPATTSARRSSSSAAVVAAPKTAAAPARLPVPAQTSAAWELEHEPTKMPAAANTDEMTDLVPRAGRGIGIGVAIGALAVVVICVFFLKPGARRSATSLAAAPAKPAATAVLAAPASVAAPAPPPAIQIAPLAAEPLPPSTPPAPAATH